MEMRERPVCFSILVSRMDFFVLVIICSVLERKLKIELKWF